MFSIKFVIITSSKGQLIWKNPKKKNRQIIWEWGNIRSSIIATINNK